MIVVLLAMVPLSTGNPGTGLTAVALVLVMYSTVMFCRMLGNLNLEAGRATEAVSGRQLS